MITQIARGADSQLKTAGQVQMAGKIRMNHSIIRTFGARDVL
jgi:hypothetical protein